MTSELLQKGIDRLNWAKTHMDVLGEVEKRLIDGGALEGLRIGMALHVEAKTGILALTLQNAGAKVRLASCNPLSTDDSVSLALNEEFGLETYARKGETNEEYYANLDSVLGIKPQLTVDDGGDLIFLLHTKYTELLPDIIGGNEETTTGIIRLKAMEAEGKLKFPVFAVNNAKMKYLFDNRYGTGQSTMEGILVATNLTIAGKRAVVAGYGWCGRGIAMRLSGLGANVCNTEIDPIKAVEARMDGFDVLPMLEAVKTADMIVSVTGCKDIISQEHLEVIKDGCVMCNSGHFDVELDLKGLKDLSTSTRTIREFVEEFTLDNGRRIYLLGEGRLINLAAAEGHPSSVMDMSFANQALSAEYMALQSDKLEKRVYPVPSDIDKEIARLKLESMGIKIDTLTPEQEKYLSSWEMGT